MTAVDRLVQFCAHALGLASASTKAKPPNTHVPVVRRPFIESHLGDVNSSPRRPKAGIGIDNVTIGSFAIRTFVKIVNIGKVFPDSQITHQTWGCWAGL